MSLIVLLVIGLIAGYIARLVVPGEGPLGVVGTLVLGVIGSFIGGFLGYVLFGHDIAEGALQPSGLLGSIIGAIIAVAIYSAVNSSGRSRRGIF